MKNNRKGFTTVELVIVIAVIAILAAVLIPTFSNLVKKANESAALQEVKAAYTIYLSDALTDSDTVTPVKEFYVTHANNTIIHVTGGKAEVFIGTVPNDAVKLAIVTHSNGKDKTLECTNVDKHDEEDCVCGSKKPA